MSTEVLERPVTKDQNSSDDVCHYILNKAYVQAVVEGVPVQALCGRVFVPHRDPSKFPVCPECHEIYESLEE